MTVVTTGDILHVHVIWFFGLEPRRQQVPEAGREGEEAHGDGRARPGLPGERAKEGRAAADEPERAEEAPARPLRVAGERRDDPEALGAVVQREADDQHERQARLAECSRLAD